MGNIGDPLTPAVPPVGSPGAQFATDIDAILTEVVARLTTKVPLASLSINSTLNMAGSPITNVGYLTLTNTISTPGAAPSNRLTAFGGDLYYVSPTGVIQLTAGGALNAASVGGITGDYTGAGPMQFRYTTATTRYDAYSNFGTGTFAFERAQGFDITASPTSAFFARLLFTGAASKTYTLPPTQPTTNVLPLYMDTSGNITAGRGSHVVAYAPFGMVGETTAPLMGLASAGAATGMIKSTSGTAQTGRLSITGLPIGFVISSFTIELYKTTAASVSYSLNKIIGAGATPTVLASGSNATSAGFVAPTVVLGVAETVDSSEKFYLELVYDTGTSGATVFCGVLITGSIPV